MPEYFYYPKFGSTFVEKMKHLIKQNEIVDMCQSIIAVIAGKYLEQLVYENCTLEVSIIQRHANKSGKKIIIESTKDSDATIEVLPLCSHKCGKSKLWDFIAEFLPDYLLATKLQILSENKAKLDRNTHYLIHDLGQMADAVSVLCYIFLYKNR